MLTTALRAMFLGHTSQLGSDSYGKHYELGSNLRKSTKPRTTTTITETGRRDASNDSDEELVMFAANSFRSGPDSLAEEREDMNGILVNKRVDVSHKDQNEGSVRPPYTFDGNRF